MLVKIILDEDFTNYKTPSMVIGFPKCTFKCDKECNKRVCQNSVLALSPNIEIGAKEIVDRYMKNNFTTSIVFGGLEPLDTFDDVIELVKQFREKTDDDICLYTGYYKYEIENEISILSKYKNIIVKFGRYIPSQEKHFDEVLGVELASDNQYAERIS